MLKKMHYMDYTLLIPYLILSGIGIVMVYSSSSYVAAQNGLTPTGYLIKQIVWVVIGLGMTFIVMNLRIRVLKNRTMLGLVGMLLIAMLGFLMVRGKTINGAAGWITLGSVSLQPAEFCKFFIIVYLAEFVTQRADNQGLAHWGDMVKQFVMIGAMLVLILIQPDLGGAAINLMIAIVILFASGIHYFIGVGILGGAVGLVEFVLIPAVSRLPQSVLQSSYKLRRFIGFLNPFETASGAGAQLVNSYYAISNGGLTGVGIGNSLQKRGYLPEPNTDFIMSIIAEELGLIGVLVIMFLLAFMVHRIVKIGVKSKSRYNTLVCYGVATYLTVQAFINVGGLLGLIPITGVTFPFISYGGSSMMVLTLALGLVLNISALEKIERTSATVHEAD
ncbi:FtsW/RodA/SpoVE family cell cycle protein [Lactiplantibacillus plajomi]|uniref:Probable peptidoglycan glycosyltransferase FtsW n=1 Tax=Lactiplantibacillus plajomi TaxID=1457217 RepID=A0ABV6K3F2_9LACO|nr:FtsW/RodA/SpoVE family cell cycle protein [Lactiplantibacillus plajomi]